MARENINNGAFPNDPTADDLRVGFEKVNDNFEELYGFVEKTPVSLNVGNIQPPASGPFDMASDVRYKLNTRPAFTLNPQATPLMVSAALMVQQDGINVGTSRYVYLVKVPPGAYGTGHTPIPYSALFLMSVQVYTPADIEADPNIHVEPLTVPDGEDFWDVANAGYWDWSDNGEVTETGVIQYYFTFEKEGELQWAYFTGAAGIYGSGETPFTEEMFLITIKGNPEPDKTKLSQFVNDGDGVSPFETVAHVNGLTVTVNQPTAELFLKNHQGTTLATVNLGFLNNEGTTFYYNAGTGNLELKNDAGDVLSVIPVSAFVSNLMQSVDFNVASPQILEFKDASGNVVDSVTFTIANIQGLQTALNAKANDDDVIHKTGNESRTGNLVNNGVILANGVLAAREIVNGERVDIVVLDNGLITFVNSNISAVPILNFTAYGNKLGINIGSTVPSYNLDVNGNGRFTGEVLVPVATASGSAVPKSQLDAELTSKANANGSNASGDWNINISGAADNALKLGGYDYNDTGAPDPGADSFIVKYDGELRPMSIDYVAEKLQIKQIRAAPTVDFPSVGSSTSAAAAAITVPGAAVGDVVDFIPHIDIVSMSGFEQIIIKAYVTAADTVTAWISNNSTSGSFDAPARQCKIIIRK